jgi:hypothetical protein
LNRPPRTPFGSTRRRATFEPRLKIFSKNDGPPPDLAGDQIAVANFLEEERAANARCFRCFFDRKCELLRGTLPRIITAISSATDDV